MTHALRATTTGIIALSLSQTAREMNQDVVDCCLAALLGSINPKSTCVFKKRYRMHNHRVKSIVPPEKLLGMLVVSLRGVNFVFWYHLGCSGQNAIIFSREGPV